MDKKISFENLTKYSDADLNKIKRFAFAPTGILGVHDFMIGRKMEGILHIIISVFCFVFCTGFGEVICKSVGNCRNASEIDTFYHSTLFLGVLFLIGSYIWAFFEGDAINSIIAKRHQPAKIEPSPAQPKEIEKNNVGKERNSKSYLIVSIVLFLFSILIITLPLIVPATCQMNAVNMDREYCDKASFGGVFIAIPLIVIEFILWAVTISCGVIAIANASNKKWLVIILTVQCIIYASMLAIALITFLLREPAPLFIASISILIITSICLITTVVLIKREKIKAVKMVTS